MSIVFDQKQGPVLVKAEVSGLTGAANLELLLDTGATSSLIHSTRLISLGYDPDASPDRLRVTRTRGHSGVWPGDKFKRLSPCGMARSAGDY